MSYMFPKRINELSMIDSDLDTPDKPRASIVKDSNRLPKRVAELDLQDSDSDEGNNQFNCAILDDSFILTPSKKIDLGDTPIPKKSQHTEENDKNVINKCDSGFESFDAVKKANDGVLKPQISQDENQLQLAYRPIKSRTQLSFGQKSTLQEKKKTEAPSMPSVFQKSYNKDDVETGFAVLGPRKMAEARNESAKALESCSKADLETPLKKPDQHLFATPSLRPQSFSVLNVKPASNPTQQALTCERKPQAKILFTTPISRPPPGSLLESTPIELRKPPAMTRKLSPIKEPSMEKEKTNEQTLSINTVEYIVDKKIGSGGSSSVFLARGKASAKEFAIKLVNLDGDQQVIDGYLNETKLLAKLQGNRSVVTLFDYYHAPLKKILYMVMEKGESDLHKILQGYKTHIPLYTLVTYWHQMLEAVDYIHKNGVIHSDLKPANFLMIGGRLKLIDFGIASNIAIDSTSIIKFSQAGTFNYISPEALIDTSTGDSPSTHHQPKIRLSTKSDVWSLGCIFYLLLFKKTPFSHMKVIHQKITALTNPNTVIEYPALPSFYPPMLVEMVQKCLVYNPKARMSVADLLKYPFEMLIPINVDELK